MNAYVLDPDSAARPVALVTGAASGIGAAVAERLLADGFAVGLHDRTDAVRERFHDAVLDDRAVCVIGDVTDVKSLKELVQRAQDVFGVIDVVVNNAGTGGAGQPFATMSLEQLRHTLEVNTVAVTALTQLAVPYLRRSSRARVVNIGSLFADSPSPNGADYSMSKGAILALTRALAVELGGYDITCNAIAPGFILTPMHEEEVALQASSLGITVEERFAQLRAEVPLGRHGTPEDIAGAVSWLASGDSAYVTGIQIDVNGGVNFS